MRKFIFSIVLMLFPVIGAFAQEVAGKWKLEDGSAIVEVYKSGNVYNGKIVWLKNPTEADGTPAVDDREKHQNDAENKLSHVCLGFS